MKNQRKPPKVLILTFTPTSSAPRVLKQINLLKENYDVTTAGFGGAAFPDVDHIKLEPYPAPRGPAGWRGVYGAMMAARQFSWVSRHSPRAAAAYDKLRSGSWDIIVAHDVATISTALRLEPRMGILSDLHEYAPRQYEHSVWWRLMVAPYMRWLVRNRIRQADKVTTVSQGIVDEYKNQYGVESSLVINATPFKELPVRKVGSPIRLVHSGIASPARQLETMILGVQQSDADVTLDLYLMNTDPAYLEKLKSLAGDDRRIVFREPVPYTKLIDTLNRYDIGISLIAPATFNLKWCLPNKFFDFIQARLGVIIGPSAEMVNFVERYGIGTVTADFSPEAFADTLNHLSPARVYKWKQASDTHAEELSAERNVEVWGGLVAEIEAAHVGEEGKKTSS